MAETGQMKVSAGFLSALQRSGNEFEAVVNGQSMGISIPAGSRIKVHPIDAAAHPISHGDIVVHVAANGPLVAHRVVALGRNLHGIPFVVTRGDNQTLCDMPIDTSTLQGIVTAIFLDSSWETPSQQAPRHGVLAQTISTLTLWIVKFWAWVSGASQRQWISQNLFRLRTL